MDADYIKQLEEKIEQYEEELGKIQVYQDYVDEIIDIAAKGYEAAKFGIKLSKSACEKSKFQGQLDVYTSMMMLAKKFLRELEK